MCEIGFSKKAVRFMKEMDKDGEKDKEEVEVIYELKTSFVQSIAVESIGREMTEDELNEFEYALVNQSMNRFTIALGQQKTWSSGDPIWEINDLSFQMDCFANNLGGRVSGYQ